MRVKRARTNYPCLSSFVAVGCGFLMFFSFPSGVCPASGVPWRTHPRATRTARPTSQHRDNTRHANVPCMGMARSCSWQRVAGSGQWSCSDLMLLCLYDISSVSTMLFVRLIMWPKESIRVTSRRVVTLSACVGWAASEAG